MPANPSITSPKANFYRGRFAPSPTGKLHFGSIVCAIGSYLQAKSQQGEWLVRIEDIDPPREVTGSADHILFTLESLGLHWDGEVLYQSKRLEAYEYALEQLNHINTLFSCKCSRKTVLAAAKNTLHKIYPGTCKLAQIPLSTKNTAIRVKVSPRNIFFKDNIQGPFSQQLDTEVGDFILKRADGLFSYQLAVVVDDDYQKITEIVRGADLLENTPRQIYLQNLLGLQQLHYSHLPVAVDGNGTKISKSTQATAVNIGTPTEVIYSALKFLGQNPPKECANESLDNIWLWAIKHWNIQNVPLEKNIAIIATKN